MSDCRNPALGAHVDGYVDGTLPDSTRDAFEQHLFECQACLEEVEARQALTESLRTTWGYPPRRIRHVGLTAALAIAAVIVAAAILVPRMRSVLGPAKTPFILTLEGTVRGDTGAPVAPRDTPLILALAVPVRRDRPVSYEVRIVDAKGRVVRAQGGLLATSPNEVRFDVGRLPAGAFDALLRETADEPGGVSLELHYRFTVGDSGTQ